MSTLKHSGWNNYGLAVLSVTGSIILTFALLPLVHQRIPLLPFVVAVLVSAWYGGLKPGLAATFLGALSADYFSNHGDLALLILLVSIGIAVSILTEKVHIAQAVIIESRERLDLATAASGVGIFESFPKEDRVIWTPQMEILFGLDPGTFLGTYSDVAERVHADDWERLQALRADCECHRRPQMTAQFRAIRPDGGIRWMETRCRHFYDDSGSLQRSVGVAMDITERKQNEIELGNALERLTENNHRLSLAQRAAKFGVWERNPAAQKDWWSDEYYDLYALSRDAESSWENWLASIEPEDRERVNREARTSFEQGRDIHLEFRVRRPDGVRWFLAAGETLKDRDGKPNRMVGVSIDITGQKRIEEELKQSNQDLEQFASIVSHDLQTPLHFVETFSKWLSEQYAGRLDPQADQYLKSIQASIQRMRALITGLLAHARVAGEDDGVLALPVDCNEVLARTLLNLGPEITAHGASVTSDRLPTIPARDFQIEELFQNLIHNALRYRSAEPPRIHVSAKLQSNEWVCSVEDNGIGFEMAESDRIFKPFERVYRGRQDHGAGMGLSFTIPQGVLHENRAGD